jgi:hypothetical protein
MVFQPEGVSAQTGGVQQTNPMRKMKQQDLAGK